MAALIATAPIAASTAGAQAQINFNIPTGFVNGVGGVWIPQGKRFVAEYASLYVRDFPTRNVVRAWANGGLDTVRHYFVPTRTGLDSGGAAVTVAGQPVRFHVEGETYGATWATSSAGNSGASPAASGQTAR